VRFAGFHALRGNPYRPFCADFAFIRVRLHSFAARENHSVRTRSIVESVHEQRLMLAGFFRYLVAQINGLRLFGGNGQAVGMSVSAELGGA